MNRWIVPLALAAAVLTQALAPATVAAQADLDIRITPRVGAMTPVDWFYEEFLHFGLDPLEWTEATILEAAVVGASVEVELPGTAIWIRGDFLRTVDAITSMTHAVLIETNGFEPPRVQRTPYRVATAVTMGALDLGFPTMFSVGPVQPYVVAGVGAKRYDFDTDPFLSFQDEVVLPQSGVVGMLNLGAGATVRVPGGLLLDLQVKDAMSDYWGRTQHDMLFLAGVTWEVY